MLTLTVVLFTTTRWTQPQYPTVGKRINKIWYIHTTECYSALRRKEILARATTWTNLKNIMLSDIRQIQKKKYCMIALT